MSCKNNCTGCGCGVHGDLIALAQPRTAPGAVALHAEGRARVTGELRAVVTRPELSWQLMLSPGVAAMLTTVPSFNVHPDELRPGDPWWPAPLNVKVAVGPLDV